MKWTFASLVDAFAVAIVVAAGAVVGTAFVWNWLETPSISDLRAMEEDVFFGLAVDGKWLGPKDAPVVILLYQTYNCGYCGELEESLVTLRERYPDHLAVVVKQFVNATTSPGVGVALGAECAAEQERTGVSGTPTTWINGRKTGLNVELVRRQVTER